MTTPAYVYKKRLLKLAAFLEALPRKSFDYTHWAGVGFKGKLTTSCGTTACALGWAAAIPSFRRLGLRLTDPDPYGWRTVQDIRSGARHFNAAIDVFCLTMPEAEYLFTPDEPNYGYFSFDSSGLEDAPGDSATPRQVAKHIRAFVAAKYPDKPSRRKRSSLAHQPQA